MKKRILSGIIAIAMAFTLVACEKGGEETPDNATPNDTDLTSFTYSTGLDANGLWEGLKARDIAKFEYVGLEIAFDEHSPSKEETQKMITDYLEGNGLPIATEEITDRPIEDGDYVNIDFVGYVDDVAFEGGSSEGAGTDVTAGSSEYIDDFLTQIIGHSPGETVNVEVTFPDPYQNAELAGKPALFVVEINYIHGEFNVTDEYVAEHLAESDWETAEALYTAANEQVETNKIYGFIQKYFLEQVLEDKVPDFLISNIEKSTLKSYNDDAIAAGQTLEEYLAETNYKDVETLLSTERPGNLEKARIEIAIQSIAEDMALLPTDEEMDIFFGNVESGSQTGETRDGLIEQYGLSFWKKEYIRDMVLGNVFDNVVLLEES